MKKNIFLQIFLTLFVFLFAAMTVSYADTIVMVSNTVITGKIIKDTEESYEFANAKGKFLVKKQFIKKTFETNTFNEDIEILKKMGKQVNPDTIEKNFNAGVQIKERNKNGNDDKDDNGDKYSKYKKILQWYYGRIVLSGSYFSTFMSDYAKQYKNVETVLPSGIAAELAYEQGLDKKGKKLHNKAIPAIRIAFGYLFFTNNLIDKTTLEISGYTLQAGLMWALPSIVNQKGCFIIGAMGGMGFLDIINTYTDKKVWCATPAITAILGYEYYIKIVSIVVQMRYTFLYDTGVAFHGLGGTVGVAFKLW